MPEASEYDGNRQGGLIYLKFDGC